MSLILEALNRARQDQHNMVPVPGVDSEHYYPAAAENPWRRRALPGALAIAVLVIGVLLGRELGRDGGQAPTPATALSAVVTEAPTPPPVVSPDTATTAPVTGVIPESQKPGEVAMDPEAATGLSASPVAAPPAQPPLPAAEASAEVAALYQQPAATDVSSGPITAQAAAPAEEGAVDIARLLTAAEQALEDVRLAEHSAPFLADLSQQGKDAVPTLMYLQHDYRAAGGSTVTINGQQAHAGESVGRGVTVEEILPDSVVLTHAGQQFRLRALNSWVNL
ncbi:general secretion pathway protein GspB [Kineobactrum sediminis]|nr:general secretion pathway protein GspB [Kineobactrum sediminis]